MAINTEKEILNAMRKNPDNWKGIFYFNKKDPAIIVPKFHASMGWTLNFASPYVYVFIAAVILIAVFSEYLL